MTQRTAVLVTGSRDWIDQEPIRKRLSLYPRGTILIHGHCGKRVTKDAVGNHVKPYFQGADWVAAGLGQTLFGFHIWSLPYFRDLEKRGGPKRNECMFNVLIALKDAGHACFVEGFPIGQSIGTRGCLRIAERYNDRCERDGRHFERVGFCVTEGKI